jgi:sodium-dependent dicarboxylate transporter 2/3/5
MDALIGAFMAATAFLSMWVSNTATTLMMIPIVLSITVLATPSSIPGTYTCIGARFAPALLLSVAYGASIGGLGTLVGTPPNAFLAAFMLERYGFTIGFA